MGWSKYWQQWETAGSPEAGGTKKGGQSRNQPTCWRLEPLQVWKAGGAGTEEIWRISQKQGKKHSNLFSYPVFCQCLPLAKLNWILEAPASLVAQMVKNPPTMRETWVQSLGRSPGGGHGNPLQYSCQKNAHGQRSLEGYSSWGCKESDTTEQLSTNARGQWSLGSTCSDTDWSG